MKSTAYDWFLRIEMERAAATARRQRRQREEDDYLRRAGEAFSVGTGHEFRSAERSKAYPHRGTGVEDHKAGYAKADSRIKSAVPKQAPPKPAVTFHPPLASNANLAEGYRPVVIKVVSYATGARRAGATAKYVQRDEVRLETHDSVILADHAAVAAEIDDWSQRFESRKPSQDVVTFTLSLPGIGDSEEGRKQLADAASVAFDGHAFASRFDVSEDGQRLRLKAVVVMAGSHERLRVVEQGGFRRLSPDSRGAIQGRLEEAGFEDMRIEGIGMPSHGREGASFQLRKLVAGGPAQVAEKTLVSVQDAKDQARDWSKLLKSTSPRDTMHMVISAKSDTDREALKKAVRSFLHANFANHKFMFGMHTDKKQKGHIHAHVVLAVRGEDGEKLHPGRATFLAWRQAFAEQAQAQGLKMTATVAGQQASSQSYGKSDKAIVDAADQPRAGRENADITYNRRFPHVAAAARHRMNVSKVNPVKWAVTEKQRAVAGASLSSWQQIAKTEPGNAIAHDQVKRLQLSLVGGRFLGELIGFSKEGETDMTAQKMSESLARMNEIVETAGSKLPDDNAKAFRDRASKVLTLYASRIDLKRMQEQGIETIGGPELQRVAAYAGEHLIMKARETARVEAREADEARDAAEQALDQERRERSTDPTSSEQHDLARRTTEEALSQSHRQAHEAEAASRAAQDLARNPAEPLDPSAVQSSPHMKELREEQDQAIDRVKAASEKEEMTQTKPQKR